MRDLFARDPNPVPAGGPETICNLIVASQRSVAHRLRKWLAITTIGASRWLRSDRYSASHLL